MAQSADADHDGRTGGQESPIRAKVAIEPHPDSNCAVVNADREIGEVTHQLKIDPAECGGDCDVSQCSECHAELVFDDAEPEARAYLKSQVSTRCICPVFEKHDCIPQITGVDSGSLVVVLTVAARGTLREIIEDLRGVGASVDVEWLVNGGDYSRTAEIDVSSITEKQREALELATEAGYYETPRGADLSEIADGLGISESATSQRLNAVETKLVNAFLED